MDITAALQMTGDFAKNVLRPSTLAYVVEAAPWSVQWDGVYITRGLRRQQLLSARTTTTPFGVRSNIVHFGSFRTLYFRKQRYKLSKKRTHVLTVFHVQPGNTQYEILPDLMSELAVLHTSCQATKRDLVALGVPDDRVAVIPLGVDTELFAPSAAGAAEATRQKLGIPDDAFVVGSFQKDGVGWGAGLEPKLEKGPDVFADVLRRVADEVPVHALLVGPARGSVVQRLEKHRIPYTNVGHVADYTVLPEYYRLLDAYLISSRVEGGPKALLESWACGVPVVATRMGMVADVVRHEEDALVSAVDDVEDLATNLIRLATERDVSDRLRVAGQVRKQEFDWDVIARRYYEELYQKRV